MKMHVRILSFAICATVLYVVPSNLILAKELVSNVNKNLATGSNCPSLVEADTAFRAENYEQAMNAAKQVLTNSTDSSSRIRAYRLLITSIRSSQGYNAAITRAEQVYAYIRKTRPSKRSELNSIQSILSEMKKRKAEYELTISEQEKIVYARPGSDMAAKASLKVAACKQALGTRKDAIDAFFEVTRDYPLTRSGWKAAQELAWLKQVDQDSNRHANAELESTIRGIIEKSGRDEAAKQAWKLACGKTDYSPSYSDVLRLEAIVADLSIAITSKDNQQVKEQVGQKSADNSQPAKSSQTTKKSSKPAQGNYSVEAYQSAGLGQLPPTIAWPGNSPNSQTPKKAVSKKSSSKKSDSSTLLTNKKSENSTADPSTSPKNPSPKIPSPQPTPLLDRWVCDSQLRDCGDDKQAMFDLIDKHLSEARSILHQSKNDIKERQRALGISVTAAIWALNKLEDPTLALKICDDYLIPGLGSARQSRGDYLSREVIVITAISIWQKAGKIDKVISSYEQLIGEDPLSNTSDANRIRLAEVLASEKRYEEAISYLQQIDDKGYCAGAKTMIEELERQLEEQKNNNGEKSSETKR